MTKIPSRSPNPIVPNSKPLSCILHVAFCRAHYLFSKLLAVTYNGLMAWLYNVHSPFINVVFSLLKSQIPNPGPRILDPTFHIPHPQSRTLLIHPESCTHYSREFTFAPVSVILTNYDLVPTGRSILHNTMSSCHYLSRWNEWSAANVKKFPSGNYPQRNLPWPRVRICICSSNYTRNYRSLATFRWKSKKVKRSLDVEQKPIKSIPWHGLFLL